MPTAEPGERPSGHGVACELRVVADRAWSPLILVTRAGRIRYANPAAGWLLGRTPERLRGHDWLSLVHPDDGPRVLREHAAVAAGRGSGQSLEYRIRAADGTWKTLAALASNLVDVPEAAGVLVSATDVTEQRAQERRLRDLALRDPLTGMANRNRLSEHLQLSVGTSAPLSVVFFDIDHLRRINDCLGHTVGDIVLRSLANRINGFVPARSLVARFGGDTFVLVLGGLDEDRAVTLVWELLSRIANPLFVAGYELRVTASAGIVREDPGATPESLLRDADAALTRAKACRRGGAVVFNEQIRAQSAARLALEADLRHALSRDEFRVYFQPVVRIATGMTEGGEALLRWARPGGEVLDPGAFLPGAEEAGLIVPIGEWVIDAVMKELRRDPTLRTSVNLSPRQLAVPSLVDQVERLLALHQVPASRLAFEVTETVLMEDLDMATDTLARLRRLGCFVGLDDFGVGYSSLSYLRRLPVDFIKLDRSLVEAIDTDPQARTIAATIIALAQALSLTTIAEGVERASLVGPLADMGCHYGQGWHFGHPLPR